MVKIQEHIDKINEIKKHINNSIRNRYERI